jgi:hypothetical protein
MHGEVERVPADALPEALDHLNAVFRLRVGTNRQLLRLRSASKAAGLTFDCRDAIGFKARLNDLYDVLDQLRIDADLLPGYDSSDPRFRGTLNRVQRWCEAELEDPAEAIDAIGVLRNVIALRAALTHSEREAEVPTRLTQLGLPFPVADWTLAWESIRAQVTRALRRLRLAIESDEPGDK